MVTTIKTSTIYNCPLERAFKTPILCDVSKIHTGYGLMPKVIHCELDEDWGRIGSTKKVMAAKSLLHKGGYVSMDKVLDRKENAYWKIEVYDFQMPMLSFYKFTGEWQTTELEKNKIRIDYTYHLHSSSYVLYPLNWLFGKLFWKKYMQRVLEIIRQLIISDEPYLYN